MEAKTVHALLNIALLQAITFLFIYIRYYFSEENKSQKKKLPEHELAVSIVLGFLVFFVIMQEGTPLPLKYLFFVFAIGSYVAACIMIEKNRKAKSLYARAHMIFHNGTFLKGAILQNKLTEKEIMKSLNTKGVVDLSEVDTIILEPDGELSVIYKKKTKTAA